MNKLKWILRLIITGIMFQTLFFKFSGAPESVYIFSTLKVEPWGRWFAGLSELIAGILILIPATSVFGAIFVFSIISGALLSHLFLLGIIVQNDGGLLFGLAMIVFVLDLILLFWDKDKIFNFIAKILIKEKVNE